MNFLAHVFLSGKEKEISIGNFIADSVTGKKYLDYPDKIQQGILLHRAIDTFTDNHFMWRKSKKILVPEYNHYSGVIIDMYYDHFLAKNWKSYSKEPLTNFTNNFYTLLKDNFTILPTKIQNFLPIMIEENWFKCYETIDGLEFILSQMDKRTNGKSKMKNAIDELNEHYFLFENDFSIFFEDLKMFVQKEKAILFSNPLNK